MRKPVYAGRLTAPKWNEEHVGDWPALVPEDLFRRVQRRFFGKARTRRLKDSAEFPLRRFVRCAGCNRPLTGSSSKGRSRRYAYYHCTKCNRVRTPKDELEAAFSGFLRSLEVQSYYLPLFREIVSDVWHSQRAQASAVREAVENRREALRTA